MDLNEAKQILKNAGYQLNEGRYGEYTPEEINIQNLLNEIKNNLKSDLMDIIEDNFAAKSLSFDTCDIDITNDGILKIYMNLGSKAYGDSYKATYNVKYKLIKVDLVNTEDDADEPQSIEELINNHGSMECTNCIYKQAGPVLYECTMYNEENEEISDELDYTPKAVRTVISTFGIIKNAREFILDIAYPFKSIELELVIDAD